VRVCIYVCKCVLGPYQVLICNHSIEMEAIGGAGFLETVCIEVFDGGYHLFVHVRICTCERARTKERKSENE